MYKRQVLVLAAHIGEKVNVLVASKSKDVHAGNVIKVLAPIVSGRGGGKPDMAMAGGSDEMCIRDRYLIQARGVEQTFYILGVVYFIVMLFVSQFIKRPSVEEAQLLADKSPNRQAADLSKGVTANEALKSSTFYWLWLILFINISCGLALVSAISPMAQDLSLIHI